MFGGSFGQGSLAGGEVSTTSGSEGVVLSTAHWSDYVILLKPRVMSLVVFTGFAGLIAAPGDIHPVIAFTTLLCMAVGAGASGALNMWYDADIDRLMQRTRRRPIPRGVIEPSEALAFGVFLSGASVAAMGLLVNVPAAILLAVTIGFYLFIYTMWLKRRTPQNIVIGGAAGAFPPMIGWAAVTGTVSIEAVVLFMIIFMWTPPHFWALALTRMGDYEKAQVPMLPVVAGEANTRLQILVYSVLLYVVTLLPGGLAMAGPLYMTCAVVLGGYFLWLAARIWWLGRMEQGQAGQGAQIKDLARRLFSFSIFYLFVLFLMLVVERLIGLPVFEPVLLSLINAI